MNKLGSGPIEPELHDFMNRMAHALDELFNPGEQKVGFILMTFKLGEEPGRCNYISNASREDVVALLTEQLSYFMGMPEPRQPDVGNPKGASDES